MFSTLLEKKVHLAVGLMSGTSADGIDAALVRLSGDAFDTQVEVVAFEVLAFSAPVRDRIQKAMGPMGLGNRETTLLSTYLGELFAHAALQICRKGGTDPVEVDFIGLHGQTLYHHPLPVQYPGFAVTGTLQTGSAAVVAERTGIHVVSDFRSRDMAAGGQGAPLAPYLDYLLYRHRSRGRIALNLGGIANITCIPAECGPEAVTAFDVGPGNCLLDMGAAHFSGGKLVRDEGGKMALSGRVNTPLLDSLLTHPFFALQPPKSIDKADFGIEFFRRVLEQSAGLAPADVMATLAALTVRTVTSAAMEYAMQRGHYEEVILSGGGALNPALTDGLRQALSRFFVADADEYTVPGKAKEAVLMTVLARETLLGRPGNLPSATGARRPVILGSITPGGRPAL
jgi:anhydro-N-acetylmuramic acid kinase